MFKNRNWPRPVVTECTSRPRIGTTFSTYIGFKMLLTLLDSVWQKKFDEILNKNCTLPPFLYKYFERKLI